MSIRLIGIGYGDNFIAVVPSFEFGIKKVKERNPDSKFIENFDYDRNLIQQITTDNRVINWWHKHIKTYIPFLEKYSYYKEKIS